MSILRSRSSVKKNPENPSQPDIGVKKTAKKFLAREKKTRAASESAGKKALDIWSRRLSKRGSLGKTEIPISLAWRLVFGGVFGLAFVVGAFYAHNQLEAFVGQIEEKRSQWVALSERDISLRRLSQDLAKVEGQTALIANAFPDEQAMIEFFNQVELLEAKAEVTVTAFSFTDDVPRTDEAGNHYLDFSMEVIGEVPNLVAFFENIFNLPILMKARTVSFEGLAASDCRLLFQSRVYVDSNFYAKKE